MTNIIPVVFFGSSPFSVLVLQGLLDSSLRHTLFDLVAVITSPDKPAGRGLKLTPNPINTLAQKHKLSVFTDIKEFISTPLPANCIGLVAAYGRLIGPKTLAKLNDQVYGIHPSLLPKYRGPSPLQQQILDAVTQTGVTLFKIDLGEDTGPIVVQETNHISSIDTTVSLGERLFKQGLNLFLSNLQELTTNPQLVSQTEREATDTRIFTRDDGLIPYPDFIEALKSHSLQLDRKLRAFTPWPGIWTIDPDGKRVKLLSLTPPITQKEGRPITL